MKLLLAPIAIVLLLTGCATLENNPNNARLLVSYATLKVIEQGATAEDQAQRAAKIRGIAQDAKTFLAGESLTLALLEAGIREQLKPLNLSPADAFLADALVTTVIAELTARVGTGVLSADQVYQVSTVLAWVIDATAFAG